MIRQAILIDLDGTVALHDGVRGHHDYHLVSQDEPNWPVIKTVQSMIHDGYHPIFVSGRPDSCALDTSMWINKHVYAGAYDLFMRRTGDHREDSLVKYELFNKHIRYNYHVVAAFDDRDQVVRMYREIGLTVLQVAEGNF